MASTHTSYMGPVDPANPYRPLSSLPDDRGIDLASTSVTEGGKALPRTNPVDSACIICPLLNSETSNRGIGVKAPQSLQVGRALKIRSGFSRRLSRRDSPLANTFSRPLRHASLPLARKGPQESSIHILFESYASQPIYSMSDQLSAEQRAAWVKLCLCPTAEEWANNLSLASNSDFNTMGESIWLFMDWAGNDPASEWERDQLTSRYAVLRQLKIPREVVVRSFTAPPSSRDFLASDDVGEIIHGLLEITEEAIQCDRDWGSSDEGRSLVLDRYGTESVEKAEQAFSTRDQEEGRATRGVDENQWATDLLENSYNAAINAPAMLAASIVERDRIWLRGLHSYYARGRRI